MKKYNNLLFFVGVFLITTGIVIKLVSDNWTNLALGITVTGITILFATVIAFLSHNKGFWSMRSTEAGTNALVATVAVIIILGLVNFLAVKYSFRADFTETQLYTLSPQSQQLVKKLAQPLTVYVFDSPPNNSDRTLLANYARYNPNFKFEFVDPQVKIGLAEKFKVDTQGNTYIEYGDKQQLVQTVSPTSRLSETKLTNAIAKIQQTTQLTIYILQGHGEPSLQQGAVSFAQAVASLEDKGYIVQPLNLANSPLVPPDASALIISGGERELLTGEVETIKKYVNQGGSLLLMYNADSKVGNIANLLNDWGITFDNGLVVDASGTGEVFGLGPSVTLVVNYGSHPITQDFNNGITVFPWARAIITQEKDKITATSLLITNPQTWAESDTSVEEVQLDPTTDLAGPLDIGVALIRENPNNPENKTNNNQSSSSSDNTPQSADKTLENPQSETNTDLPQPPTVKTPEENPTISSPLPFSSNKETKMIVIGNANFATNGWFQQQLNGDLFLNSVSWLANEDNSTLSISPREATNRRINLSLWQTGLIGWLALVIIPGLGFIVAIATWWQRSR